MDGLAVAGSCRRSLGVHTGSSAVLLILYPQRRRRGDETVGRAASHFGPAETGLRGVNTLGFIVIISKIITFSRIATWWVSATHQ
jgi:hypothetical protein